MHWLSQGWGARVSSGAAVEVNGARICNVDDDRAGAAWARRARVSASVLDGHRRGAKAEPKLQARPGRMKFEEFPHGNEISHC